VSSKTKKGKSAQLSLKDAFEVEFARRELERRAREDAERKQQEADLAAAERLLAILKADEAFLAKHALTVDRRRYTVSLDHHDYRIQAYFEAGQANVTAADKRTTVPGSVAPRKQLKVDSIEEALRTMAQYLVDETL
jgi:hypothetical protein